MSDRQEKGVRPVNCAVAEEILGAFFDGELDANSELQLRLHVSGCERCTAILGRLQSLRDRLRSADLTYPAPSGLEARIRRSIQGDRAMASHWRVWAVIAAAILLVSTLSIRLLQERTGEAQLAEAAISSHVRAMITGHTADVISTDRHTVKPWFNGRIDFSPPVVDLAAQGFPLTGGRVDYLGGRSVATLVYQRRKHVIDLFIWPIAKGELNGNESSRGYNVLEWSAGGMRFVAVSDLNETELRQFRDLLLSRTS